MDWHKSAISLARDGLSMAEIFDTIRNQCLESNSVPPSYNAIASHLHRNKESLSDSKRLRKFKQPFDDIKSGTIKAAKELMYDDFYISQLRNATTEEELTRIMINARRNSYTD